MKQRFSFTAALLAGGRSRRMGRDKAGLSLGGVPFWQHQLATLRALEPDQLLISGPRDGPFVAADCEIAPDETPGLGPLGGLASILRDARCEFVLVLAIDLPRVTSTLLATLLKEVARTGCGIVPSILGKIEPLAAVVPRACLPLVKRCLLESDRSMRTFISAAREQQWLVEHALPDEEAARFLNVNTEADWRAASGE